MESKYTQETLPVPNNSKIRITEIKDRVMAVISFSGRWSQKNFEKHEQILVNDLKNFSNQPTPLTYLKSHTK